MKASYADVLLVRAMLQPALRARARARKPRGYSIQMRLPGGSLPPCCLSEGAAARAFARPRDADLKV